MELVCKDVKIHLAQVSAIIEPMMPNKQNKLNWTQIEELSLYLLGTVGLFALMDRLVMGAFQRRSGPYSIGWFGLLQPIVDGIKLIKKESIIVQK